MVIKSNEVTDFYYIYSQVTLILRLRSVTSLTLARANQFNNKLLNTCGKRVAIEVENNAREIKKTVTTNSKGKVKTSDTPEKKELIQMMNTQNNIVQL